MQFFEATIKVSLINYFDGKNLGISLNIIMNKLTIFVYNLRLRSFIMLSGRPFTIHVPIICVVLN